MLNPQEVRTRIHKTRGEILQEQIACEQLLTLILDSYYGSKHNPDHHKVHRDLITNLNFSRKIYLVCNILKEFKTTNSVIIKIRKNLEFIREVRNGIAHKQWHTLSENLIVFGLDEKAVEVDETFINDFKKRVQDAEKPLIAFYFEKFDPNEILKPKTNNSKK